VESRTITFSTDDHIIVGRQVQPAFFEAVVGSEAKYMAFISRSHFKMVPKEVEFGTFELTNLSSNPIKCGGVHLGKNEKASVRQSEHVDFTTCESSELSEITYLRLCLCMETLHTLPVEEEPFGSCPSAMFLGNEQPKSQSVRSGMPSVQFSSVPAAVYPRSTEGVTRASVQTGNQQKQSNAGPFWLTLGGSLVRDNFPCSYRRLEGCEDGLVVGRSHQLTLHKEAMREDVLQYLSREHFCVEPTVEGWCISPMSANPIWHVHHGVCTEVTRTLPLVDGDRITLFTGAFDCTLDGPGSLGTLYWDFSCESPSSCPAQNPITNHTTRPGVASALQAPFGFSLDEDKMEQVPPKLLDDTDFNFELDDHFGASGFRW